MLQSISRLSGACQLALVGDGESLSAFATTCGQHFSTVGGGHSLAETVLVGSLSRGRLECSLHNILSFLSYFSTCSATLRAQFWSCKSTQKNQYRDKKYSIKNLIMLHHIDFQRKTIIKIKSFSHLKIYLYICNLKSEAKILIIC